MNILNIDVQDSIPDIIDAYTEVYGVENRDIIEKRLKEIRFVFYNNILGVMGYVNHVESCNKKEIGIQFLKQIGFDVSKYEEGSYTEEIDESISLLLENYLGPNCSIFDNNFKGIKAWKKPDTDTNLEEVEEEQINFINFIRGNNTNPITRETFKDFSETEEYREILGKINECLKVYNQLIEDNKDFKNEIEEYREYYINETLRANNILHEHRNKLLEKTYSFLPNETKRILDSKDLSIDDKSMELFGYNIGCKSYIEYFSKKYEDILNDPNASENDKETIYNYRCKYFEMLGIVSGKTDEDFETNKEFYNYCMQQEYVSEVIPSNDLIDNISKCRIEEYERYQMEFICNSEDFVRNSNRFPDAKEAIYYNMRNQEICVSEYNTDEGIKRMIFITVRMGEEKFLNNYLLHEICHYIECTDTLSGFDIINDKKSPKNPYNSKLRLYTKLNETITNIFDTEARQFLQKRNIYPIEPKKYACLGNTDMSTTSRLKGLVSRFLSTYRKQIIKSRLTGNMEEMYNYIGQENFEALNDVINKVSSLEDLGLNSKLRNNQVDDTIVLEYNKQLERLEEIYANMETYHSKDNISNDDEANQALLNSAIRATEATVRSPEIDIATSILERNEQPYNRQTDDNIRNFK